jgi:hypothetical protein
MFVYIVFFFIILSFSIYYYIKQRDQVQIINGEFSPWYQEGSCSHPCGEYNSTFKEIRICDNPPPTTNNGAVIGENCKGATTEIVPCTCSKKNPPKINYTFKCLDEGNSILGTVDSSLLINNNVENDLTGALYACNNYLSICRNENFSCKPTLT